MRLDVMRHGATPSTQGHRFNDEGESLLTETMATLGAVKFDGSAYDRIDVSSMPRAVQTAEGLRLPRFNVDARLAERGLGVFQGLTAIQCRARFAVEIDAFNLFEADYCIPGGESRGAHLARVLAWLDEVGTCGAEQRARRHARRRRRFSETAWARRGNPWRRLRRRRPAGRLPLRGGLAMCG